MTKPEPLLFRGCGLCLGTFPKRSGANGKNRSKGARLNRCCSFTSAVDAHDAHPVFFRQRDDIDIVRVGGDCRERQNGQH